MSLLILVTAWAGYGCGGAADSGGETAHVNPREGAPASPEGPSATSESELDDAAWRATWRRLSIPSASFESLGITSTPSGWMAVSSRDFDIGKIVPTYESSVYRSRDGTHWNRVPILEGEDALTRASLAYGGGHYVITGSRGANNVVLSSVDGETWREQVLDEPYLGNVGAVKYVRDRFFSMGFSLWSSTDGETWTRLAHPYMFSSFADITFGAGQYVGVGSATLLSLDGVEWQLAPIDCALPGACITLPGGDTQEDGHSWVFFAEGHYHVGALSSADGHSWEALPTPYPDAYAGGHLMTAANGQLGAWLSGDGAPRPMEWLGRRDMLPVGVSEQDARRWSAPPEADMFFDDFPLDRPLPDSFDFSWRDGLDCTAASCLIVEAEGYPQLYLVP